MKKRRKKETIKSIKNGFYKLGVSFVGIKNFSHETLEIVIQSLLKREIVELYKGGGGLENSRKQATLVRGVTCVSGVVLRGLYDSIIPIHKLTSFLGSMRHGLCQVDACMVHDVFYFLHEITGLYICLMTILVNK